MVLSRREDADLENAGDLRQPRLPLRVGVAAASLDIASMICFFRCGNDNVVRHAYSPATPVEDYKLLLTLTLILSLTLSPVGVARCRCGATGSGSPTRECAAPRARRPCLGRPRRPSRHPHREAEQAEAATEGVGSEQSHCHRYSSWCVVGGPRHYRENSHLGECARLFDHSLEEKYCLNVWRPRSPASRDAVCRVPPVPASQGPARPAPRSV